MHPLKSHSTHFREKYLWTPYLYFCLNPLFSHIPGILTLPYKNIPILRPIFLMSYHVKVLIRAQEKH